MQNTLERLKQFAAQFATPRARFGQLARQSPRPILIGSAAVLTGIVMCVPFHVAREQTNRNRWAGVGAEMAVGQNLARAEVAVEANLEAELAVVKQFFAAARQRTPGYAGTVLGWTSKYRLASDYVTGRKEHAAFLQQRFEEEIFSNAELDQLLQQTVSAFLRETDDVEAQMLVRLQADLDRLPAGSSPSAVDMNQIRAVLGEALHRAAQSARTELGAAAARELVSYIAGEVLTCAATQLAISAGILTTGAGSGWATFGVGIVVGIIVDAIVSKLYDWQFDPAGKLAGALNAQLDQLETLILQGTSESPGLRGRLSQYSSQRNAARRQAVRQAILAP